MLTEQLYEIYSRYPSVQTDTRKLKPGDLFFALKGDHYDGNRYAAQAIEKGAAYAIVDDSKEVISDRYLLVNDVLATMQDLALFHRRRCRIPFIAITGSNGKTTTKELVHVVLSKKYKTYTTEGNLNNHIGIPLTILRIKPDAEIAIIEMGANHQKEIEGYCRYVEPTHALITNCGKAHLEGFGGIEGVRKGKGELYDFIRNHGGVAFRNADLDYLIPMAQDISEQVTYGSVRADYRGMPVMNGVFAGAAILNRGMECTIHTQLVGVYNFSNIMAAVAVGSTFNIGIDLIKQALESYHPDNSRSQLVRKGSNTIILDAYNANPSSMKEAISNFSRTDYPNKVIVLGGMKELGEDSLTEHAQLVQLINSSNWNAVILVGGDFAQVEHAFQYFETSEAAGQWIATKGYQNTSFLIKGSRAFYMEKVMDFIQE